MVKINQNQVLQQVYFWFVFINNVAFLFQLLSIACQIPSTHLNGIKTNLQSKSLVDFQGENNFTSKITFISSRIKLESYNQNLAQDFHSGWIKLSTPDKVVFYPPKPHKLSFGGNKGSIAEPLPKLQLGHIMDVPDGSILSDDFSSSPKDLLRLALPLEQPYQSKSPLVGKDFTTPLPTPIKNCTLLDSSERIFLSLEKSFGTSSVTSKLTYWTGDCSIFETD